MRLIDADALIPTEVHTVVVLKDGREQLESVLYAEQIDDAPTVEPAVTRWHRVEEPPKESCKQYVVWASKGYAYCDKWLGDRWLISSVAPETVTHWMPIEPPKEDA
jgi:hypothetical protein